MIKEMGILLWKDYRLSRICLFAGIMFIGLPYLFLIYPYKRGYDFIHAWYLSTVLSQLAIALLAGNIVVCERADRSAAFLSYQGVTRTRIIASKLIICTIMLVSICAISIVLSFWLGRLRPGEWDDIRETQLFSYIIGFCFFGSCWLFSCILPSPISAVVFGLLCPFITASLVSASNYYFNWPAPRVFGHCIMALDITVGLISLVVGTWYFLRSKES
jgi:ABC-type transport system involved in multi-copper enzyme maturation permease subunit